MRSLFAFLALLSIFLAPTAYAQLVVCNDPTTPTNSPCAHFQASGRVLALGGGLTLVGDIEDYTGNVELDATYVLPLGTTSITIVSECISGDCTGASVSLLYHYGSHAEETFTVCSAAVLAASGTDSYCFMTTQVGEAVPAFSNQPGNAFDTTVNQAGANLMPSFRVQCAGSCGFAANRIEIWIAVN